MCVPPLVPSHMLPPSSANKMYNAIRTWENWGGRWSEVTVLPVDSRSKRENAKVFRDLLAGVELQDADLGARVAKGGGEYQWLAKVAELPSSSVRGALGGIRWATEHPLQLQLEFIDGRGGRDPRIDSWVLIAPQLKRRRLLWGPENAFTVSERSRSAVTSERFKVFSDPRHRAVAEIIAGISYGESLTPDTKRLQNARRGVILFYPVVEKGSTSREDEICKDYDVSTGFALLFPQNSIPGPRVSFSVRDHDHPDAITVSADT